MNNMANDFIDVLIYGFRRSDIHYLLGEYHQETKLKNMVLGLIGAVRLIYKIK